MRTEWLEYFADAARLGSIKASADKHCISPQGLSRTISSLENELGVKLFIRGANNVSLTQEGEQLLPVIKSAVAANQYLSAQAHKIVANSNDMPGRMLCSTFVFLSGLMEPLGTVFNESSRNISFMQVDTDRIFDMLLGGPEDGASNDILFAIPIMFDPMQHENDARIAQLAEHGYAYEPFERHNDGIVVSKDHPLAGYTSVSREDIIRYPVIASCAEQLAPLKRYIGPSHVTMAITDLATRLHMVLDNRSIIFLPPFLDVERNDDRYRFVELSDPYSAEVGLIYSDLLLTKKDVDPVFERIEAFYSEDAKAGLLELPRRS